MPTVLCRVAPYAGRTPDAGPFAYAALACPQSATHQAAVPATVSATAADGTADVAADRCAKPSAVLEIPAAFVRFAKPPGGAALAGIGAVADAAGGADPSTPAPVATLEAYAQRMRERRRARKPGIPLLLRVRRSAPGRTACRAHASIRAGGVRSGRGS